MARPSKFENLSIIVRAAALYGAGRTDKEVAYQLGVTERTINNWKRAHPEFFQSIQAAKEVADSAVESALFLKATGYTHPHEEIFCAFGKVTRVRTLKHYPPDTAAAMHWLHNRQPDRWSRRVGAIGEPGNEGGSETSKPEITQGIKIKTFEEFCVSALYPPPYVKQVDMMKFLTEEIDPRIILGARGYGKTDYVTILGIAYDIYVHYMKGTQVTNLIISKAKTRNTAMIEEIAKALVANDVELEKKNTSRIRVKGLKGKDHSVEAITIKTSMRGRHPDRVVMDDPVTDEDVSAAMRKLVKRRYDEVLKLCTNVLVIGQPAHKHDLYATLRPLLKGMELPHGSIPELDHDLEAQRLAGVDEASIRASYFLEIINDGSMPFEKINYIDRYPKADSVAFIDPSDGGDFTALSIFRGRGDGAVNVFGKIWQRAWFHCLDDIERALLERGVKKLAFEINSTGNQPIDQLAARFAKHQIGVVAKFSTKNKHSRIMQAGSFASSIYLAKESDRKYIEQVVEYEEGVKNDDAPDSLATGLEWIGLIRGK